MKYFNLIILLFTIFLIQSCSSTKKSTLWVSGEKSPCSAGAGKMDCLNVYEGDKLENAVWENFYANIEGFEFEEGVAQKIEVEQIMIKNPPADASSIRYKLLQIKEKVETKNQAVSDLHDIWVLTEINGEKVNKSENLPQIELNLTENTIMGTDGCNQLSGQISDVNNSEISFSEIVSTQKMCLEMEIPDKFNQALNSVKYYKRENLNLHFFDSEKNKVLSFLKID